MIIAGKRSHNYPLFTSSTIQTNRVASFNTPILSPMTKN